MSKEILKWQSVILLLIVIVFSGNYVFEKVFEERPSSIGVSTSGELTAVTKIVTAEQKQVYSRFVDTKVKNKLIRAVTLGLLKGTLYFQWEAKNTYGIDVSSESPIKWQRTNRPGEIEIIAPRLSVLDSKILIDSDKYVVRDVNKSMAISEKRIKKEYRDIQVLDTKNDAIKVLKEPRLIQISRAVIADHVMQILNQGLTTDKIHKAIVKFR